MRSRGAPGRALAAGWVVFILASAQVVAGAAMVLAYLPATLRGVHAALGTAVWVALVWLAWVAAPGVRVPVPEHKAAAP
jgi:heme A synthase